LKKSEQCFGEGVPRQAGGYFRIVLYSSVPYNRTITKTELNTMARIRRSGRLDLRVAPDEKELIDRAAALTGSNTTDFVRSTTLAAAQEAIRTHEVTRLTSEGSRVFVEVLINPPEPNEHLRALAEEFGESVGR
jgi:uncharacterized protein (DUF1778 family)